MHEPGGNAPHPGTRRSCGSPSWGRGRRDRETQALGLQWAWKTLQAPEAVDRRPTVCVLPPALCASVSAVCPSGVDAWVSVSVCVSTSRQRMSPCSVIFHPCTRRQAHLLFVNIQAHVLGTSGPPRFLPNPPRMVCTARTVPACVPREQTCPIQQNAPFPEGPACEPRPGCADFSPNVRHGWLSSPDRFTWTRGELRNCNCVGRGRQPEGARCPCSHTMAV